MNETPAPNTGLDWARREIGVAVVDEAARKYGPLVPYAFGVSIGFGLFLFVLALTVEKKVGL